MAVLITLALAVLIAYVLMPGGNGEAISWLERSAPSAAGLLYALGFGALTRSWWFLTLIAIAALQLAIVTVRLVTRDARRLLRGRGPASPNAFEVTDTHVLGDRARTMHYIRMREDTSSTRYVRHPWGYFGSSVLHAGMLMALVGVLVVSLTQSVGLLVLAVGETAPGGTGLQDAAEGPLGASTVLESDLTLEDMDAAFWDNGEPRSYTGHYLLEAPGGDARFALTVNKSKVVDGIRFFQEQRVGYTWLMTVSYEGAVDMIRLELAQPSSSAEASYADFVLANGDLLQAKCLVDESAGTPPVLVIRLVRNESVVAQQTVTEGGTILLDDVELSTDDVLRHGVITVDRTKGYPILFASFFVIFLGAFLIYATPPRDLTLTTREDGVVVADWYVARFATLYADEERCLREAATGEEGEA